jgi:hypothetical protein
MSRVSSSPNGRLVTGARMAGWRSLVLSMLKSARAPERQAHDDQHEDGSDDGADEAQDDCHYP